jgi:hypothetical protein
MTGRWSLTPSKMQGSPRAYYRLIVDDGNRTAPAILEVEVVNRTFPDGPERESLTRYQLKVADLVELIQKHGTRLP